MSVQQSTFQDEECQQGDLDEAAWVFLGMRPRLFQIAYRILGSVAETEDLLQEVWLRWQGTDRTAVLNPMAFLTTMTSRMAINVARSARLRRETLDPGFYEPADGAVDPPDVAEHREAVETAVLILLERLTPSERAAYVLREAFDYPYHRIAEVLQLHAPNTRQLVKRARDGLASRGRRPVNDACRRRFHDAFVSAARTGYLADLESLLVADLARSSRAITHTALAG